VTAHMFTAHSPDDAGRAPGTADRPSSAGHSLRTGRPTGLDVSRSAPRRAFSLVEMLIALAISAALLTASLAALDASFKSYKMTSESASTHVVSRIVMQRVMAMIRTGKEFGPYPDDVLDPAQNPLVSTYIEFVSLDDPAAERRQITRIERRTESGHQELWFTITTYVDGVMVETQSRPLIQNLQDALFTLEFDVGPRLRRATVDLTIQPDDLQDGAIAADTQTPVIRYISSATPRQLQ
jgi:prepilin-type N-terminal cleavage/methylation domain-containing protein